MADGLNLIQVRAELEQARRLVALGHEAIGRSAESIVQSQSRTHLPAPVVTRRLRLQCPVASPLGSDVAANGVHDAEMASLAQQVQTLQQALLSRDTIGMAKGILMARENCGPEEAFHMLRRVSQRTNRKLAAIAQEIVASSSRMALN